MLALKNVSLRHDQLEVLKACHLEFLKGKINCLLGPSGCGKSTVLNLLSRLEKVDSGEVHNPFQRISFVFQEPRLLPWLNVVENIQLGSKLSLVQPPFHLPLLKRLKLSGCETLFPHQLSGGMKMRTSLARALLTGPELLLMDEPFSALDEMIRHELQDFLLEFQAESHCTIVFVTHSFSEAAYLGDQITLLEPQYGKTFLARASHLGHKPWNRNSQEYIHEVQFWSNQMRISNHEIR